MATTNTLDVAEIARQVEQSVGEAVQAVKQVAQQAAEDVAQSVQDVKTAAQAVQEAARGAGTEGSTTDLEVSPADRRTAWAANFKRMFDDYMAVSLTEQRRSQTHFDNLQAQMTRLLSNSIDNDDAREKQQMRHADLSITREVLDVVALTKAVKDIAERVNALEGV